MAIAFAHAGARVVVADIELDSAARTAAEIGKKTIEFGVDSSDGTSVLQLVQRAVDEFVRTDVLCDNAGIPGPHRCIGRHLGRRLGAGGCA